MSLPAAFTFAAFVLLVLAALAAIVHEPKQTTDEHSEAPPRWLQRVGRPGWVAWALYYTAIIAAAVWLERQIHIGERDGLPVALVVAFALVVLVAVITAASARLLRMSALHEVSVIEPIAYFFLLLAVLVEIPEHPDDLKPMMWLLTLACCWLLPPAEQIKHPDQFRLQIGNEMPLWAMMLSRAIIAAPFLAVTLWIDNTTLYTVLAAMLLFFALLHSERMVALGETNGGQTALRYLLPGVLIAAIAVRFAGFS